MITLSNVLTSILSAGSSALNAADAPVGLAHLAPGAQAAWDDCCEGGGQLWLRVIEIYPTAGKQGAFPAIDSRQQGGCGVNTLAIQLGIGTVRCAHTVNDQGIPPTATEMTNDALAIMLDEHVLLDAIMCDVPDLPGVQALKLNKWSPQGPSGGCAGGEWTFYIAFAPCLCSEA